MLDWNEHCSYCIKSHTTEQHKEFINILLDLPTCFISETSELLIFTTERGAKTLSELSTLKR